MNGYQLLQWLTALRTLCLCENRLFSKTHIARYRMKSRLLSLPLFLIMLIALLSGCAVVDQKINLVYKPVDRPLGRNSGEVLVSRIDPDSQLRNTRGEWIVGALNNVYGVRQADLLSDLALGDWVTGALLQELKQAGYSAAYTGKLPDGAAKAIVISDINVKMNVNLGNISTETRHELKFNVDIMLNGLKVKTLSVAARDNKTFPLNASQEDKERIMRNSLQDAMQQVIPDLILLFNRK